VALAWGCLTEGSLAVRPRPLSTDRPDTTESPQTVDEGCFQFEMEVASWSEDRAERELTVAELNAKWGLSSSSDLQLVIPFYKRVVGGDEGVGDLELRLKYNLWGNDEGATALAVMPFVKLPTANGDLGDGLVEGGVMVPYGFEGPAGWDCGVMVEADLTAGNRRGSYALFFLTSATASHTLSENSSVFVEWVNGLGTDGSSSWEVYFNTGLTWAASPDLQIDCGIRVGLTAATPDWVPFVGVSTRF
jgi:hypothetical protein